MLAATEATDEVRLALATPAASEGEVSHDA